MRAVVLRDNVGGPQDGFRRIAARRDFTVNAIMYHESRNPGRGGLPQRTSRTRKARAARFMTGALTTSRRPGRASSAPPVRFAAKLSSLGFGAGAYSPGKPWWPRHLPQEVLQPCLDSTTATGAASKRRAGLAGIYLLDVARRCQQSVGARHKAPTVRVAEGEGRGAELCVRPRYWQDVTAELGAAFGGAIAMLALQDAIDEAFA